MTSPRRVHSAGDAILCEIADLLGGVQGVLAEIRDRLPSSPVGEPVTAPLEPGPEPADTADGLVLVTEPDPAEPPLRPTRKRPSRTRTNPRKGT